MSAGPLCVCWTDNLSSRVVGGASAADRTPSVQARTCQLRKEATLLATLPVRSATPRALELSTVSGDTRRGRSISIASKGVDCLRDESVVSYIAVAALGPK